jgi:hypothetical protein
MAYRAIFSTGQAYLRVGIKSLNDFAKKQSGKGAEIL